MSVKTGFEVSFVYEAIHSVKAEIWQRAAPPPAEFKGLKTVVESLCFTEV